MEASKTKTARYLAAGGQKKVIWRSFDSKCSALSHGNVKSKNGSMPSLPSRRGSKESDLNYCKGTPSRRHEASRDIMAMKGKGAKINAIRMADIGHHQHKVPNTWKPCFISPPARSLWCITLIGEASLCISCLLYTSDAADE